MKWIKNAVALGFILSLIFSQVASHQAQGKAITLKGSDTMVLLGQRWAEVYMKKTPGSRIQVTGGGSGTGIAALINGTTDICEASRPMKDKEKEEVKAKTGKEVVEIPVAVDGLAIYLNASNPIQELTLDQVKQIYLGKITNWKAVGGSDTRIILYGRENNSGTYAYFKEHVLQNADFHPTTQTLPGTAAVTNAVSKDPKAIGYGGIAYAKGIRHTRVKKDANSPAIEPSMENVLSAKYPISRFLYWYVAGQPSGEIKKLVDWVLGDEGQKLVQAVGYYPLPKEISAASNPPKGASAKKASQSK
ncbi:MAG: phosphate-binding protein [Acidobacteria bacterium]|nr:MAG: phosphate-binding protein [Acidobacteriota bacterium]